MIGEESLALVFKERKGSPFPTRCKQGKYGLNCCSCPHNTERASFKDEAKSAKGRGKRKNKSGSHLTTEFNQPILKPSWTCENNPPPCCLSEFQLRFILIAAKRISTDNIAKSSVGTSTRKEIDYKPRVL